MINGFLETAAFFIEEAKDNDFFGENVDELEGRFVEFLMDTLGKNFMRGRIREARAAFRYEVEEYAEEIAGVLKNADDEKEAAWSIESAGIEF